MLPSSNEPCICGSGNKYKKCCKAHKVWVIQRKDKTHLVKNKKDIFVFSSRRTAIRYLRQNHHNGAKIVEIPLETLVKNIVPVQIKKGVTSAVFDLDGTKKISLGLRPLYRGKEVKPGSGSYAPRQIPPLDEDRLWFDEFNEDYRVRPLEPEELQDPNCTTSMVMLVIRFDHNTGFLKLAFDLDKDENRAWEWADLAQEGRDRRMKGWEDADPETLELFRLFRLFAGTV